jgi:CubicO group peptidase (beta-lactamase class C family)
MRSLLIAAAVAVPLAAHAASLSQEQKAAIDDSVEEWLAKTGAPSVSIAVASGNEIAYAKAYGRSSVDPDVAATPLTRYPIDSVSKQFTAAAVLMLQEQGKLSLDDKVAKYFPELTRANDITLRELLSHTAGYPDSEPQDFFTPAMGKPQTLATLFRDYGTKPLTFEPGTDSQYSSTGFKIAGAIVEKVSGQPFFAFLQEHIFTPLHMTSVVDCDTAPLPAGDAVDYLRYANGPIRPAPKEAPGWTFAAGGLCMTPSDLARWDISMMNRSLLTQKSYDAFYTPTKLKNGRDLYYSLGLTVWENHGRLGLGHTGGGTGSQTENRAWPAAKIAIAALSNNGWAMAGEVVNRVANVVLPPTDVEASARATFASFQKGSIDRALFTDNANFFLTPAVLADQKAGLATLGPVRTFLLTDERDQGGFHVLTWRITTAKAVLDVTEMRNANGKIEQFVINKAD